MFLVQYAGAESAPRKIPVRQPATRHERKWVNELIPAEETQEAWVKLNQKGLDEFRQRGMPEAIRDLVKQVATSRRVAIMLIASDSRMRVAVYARNEIMYMIKARNPSTSCPQMGRWFNRDHTSILHGIASHQERHNLPPLVGYNLAASRANNRAISARMALARKP